MSKLNSILKKAKKDLKPWEPIPRHVWQDIAKQLTQSEVIEVRQRIVELKNELRSVPEWDGDTQDEIFKALEFFDEIIRLFNE